MGVRNRMLNFDDLVVTFFPGLSMVLTDIETVEQPASRITNNNVTRLSVFISCVLDWLRSFILSDVSLLGDAGVRSENARCPVEVIDDIRDLAGRKR